MEILVIVILTWLFWPDKGTKLDNWEKLNTIVHHHYLDARTLNDGESNK